MQNDFLLHDAHLSVPETWRIILNTSSSIFGFRLWAEEILRIEWRCSSVKPVLRYVLFVVCEQLFTQAGAAKHWGCEQLGHHVGYKRWKKNHPQCHILPLVCRSITSIWRFKGPLSTTTAYGLPNNSNLLFSAESLQISGWIQHRACWVLQHLLWRDLVARKTSSFAASVPRTGSAWFWKPCSEPWTLSEFTLCWTLTMLGEGGGASWKLLL